jgi:mannose-6-phosphate isomerase class I
METLLKIWVGNEISIEVHPTKKQAEAAGKKFIRVLKASNKKWGGAGWEIIKR